MDHGEIGRDRPFFAEEMTERDSIAEHSRDHRGPGQAGHTHPQAGYQQNVKKDVCDICDDAALSKQFCPSVNAEGSLDAQEHFQKRRREKQGARIEDHPVQQRLILYEQPKQRPLEDQQRDIYEQEGGGNGNQDRAKDPVCFLSLSHPDRVDHHLADAGAQHTVQDLIDSQKRRCRSDRRQRTLTDADACNQRIDRRHGCHTDCAADVSVGHFPRSASNQL